MKEIGEREAEHKMELSIKYQAECKRIQAQIGQLKRKQKDALKQYQNDKMWFHRKYRDEKHEVTQQMHMLRMEYLTVANPSAINKRDSGRAQCETISTVADGISTPPLPMGSLTRKEEPSNE
jgi:hypothetical protein